MHLTISGSGNLKKMSRSQEFLLVKVGQPLHRLALEREKTNRTTVDQAADSAVFPFLVSPDLYNPKNKIKFIMVIVINWFAVLLICVLLGFDLLCSCKTRYFLNFGQHAKETSKF